MKLSLREQLSQFGYLLQSQLFATVEMRLGALTESARRLIATLEIIPLTRFIPASHGWVGRPCKDRDAIARAFIAKSIYGFTHTRQLLEALHRDAQLRQICGWDDPKRIPHESSFSRAFQEFAEMQLPQFVHETLVREIYRDQIVGHIARDSTAIEAREHYPDLPVKVTGTTVPKQEKLLEPSVETAAPVKASAADSKAPRKRGPKPGRRGAHKRWKGGKPRKQLPQGTRLERQRTQTLPKMLGELPQECNLGAKKGSNGNTEYWRGYKLHLDVADGQVPISAVLTSASVHDSQVAIPLMTMSSERVPFYCYELMDSAYDAAHIHEHSRGMGHVPIVDPHPHGKKDEKGKYPNMRQLSWAETDRYQERTMVERVNARLKDEFGGRYVRVRGAAKVMAHLMFGVLALTADQILRLVVRQI